MKISSIIGSSSYSADLQNPIEISIPLDFNGAQPNHFDVPPATEKPVVVGEFTGDVSLGGSCNCFSYQLIPHCNGTHTECVGHISETRINISDILRDSLLPATVISVRPESEAEDQLITAQSLKHTLEVSESRSVEPGFLDALIIRTIPNDESKRSRRYSDESPPFFSLEAIDYVITRGVKHLLIDIPSVDKMHDDGKLSCHHRYWNVPAGTTEIPAADCSLKTITEMIYLDDAVKDSHYLVQIQIPHFVADAAPSRVLLYPVQKEKGE